MIPIVAREAGYLLYYSICYIILSFLFNEITSTNFERELLGELTFHRYLFVLITIYCLYTSKTSFLKVNINRVLILTVLLCCVYAFIVSALKSELEISKKQFLSNVKYIEKHDAYLDFRGSNNAFAVGPSLTVIFPREIGFFDGLKSLFGYHNWPEKVIDALVSHEKGHNQTFYGMIVLEVWLLVHCLNLKVNVVLNLVICVTIFTLFSWFSELVADSNVAMEHGMAFSTMMRKEYTQHQGTIGRRSHPPSILREFIYKTDRLLWKYCFQHLNIIVGAVFIILFVNNLMSLMSFKEKSTSATSQEADEKLTQSDTNVEESPIVSVESKDHSEVPSKESVSTSPANISVEDNDPSADTPKSSSITTTPTSILPPQMAIPPPPTTVLAVSPTTGYIPKNIKKN